MLSFFNTLKYTKGAEVVDIPREYTECQAQKTHEFINNDLITKSLFNTKIDISNIISSRIYG
jgi:hypothetical protein